MNLYKERNWTPMLLKEVSEPFNDKNYLYEIKFDGIRAIIFASPSEVVIYNRHCVDITKLYPELQDIKNLVNKKIVFDGEITLFDDGKPSFLKLQSRAHLKDEKRIKYYALNCPVIFMVFDILYEDGNLIDEPLIKRKEILNKYCDSDVFMKVFYLLGDGIKLYNEIVKFDLEGIVAKDINSKYLINMRCDNWVKIKNWIEEKFYIGGYIVKDNLGTISLLLGEFKDNKLYYVGKVVMAKKRVLYKKIILERKVSNPFIDYDGEGFFIKPIYSCNVMYLQRTNNNHLRQPIFKE